jgi:hypothetical protein
MSFRVIGHPDLNDQVSSVFAADPKQGPVAVAKIRALLESFDEDPAELGPAPVDQVDWTEGIPLNVQRNAGTTSRLVAGHVAIYVYEVWGLRFAIARVQFPGNAIVGAWLMVETRVAVATGLSSRNLSLALLAKVEELIWPV